MPSNTVRAKARERATASTGGALQIPVGRAMGVVMKEVGSPTLTLASRLSYVLLGPVLLGGLLWLGGCSSEPTQEVEVDESRADLRQISQAYELAIAIHRRPPRDEATLRKILSDLHEAGESGDPDEVLRSSRDGEAYVIIYGVSSDETQPSFAPSSAILAYEKNGAEGTRYVLTRGGDISVMADQQFAQARFAGGHRPAGR